MKKNNRGMTLVEVIIVVAIMSVLLSLVGIGFSMINGRPADKCAGRLKSILQNARVTCKGKLDSYWEIKRDSDGSIVLKEYVKIRDGQERETTTVIGEKNVSIKYYVNDSEEHDIASASSPSLVLRFDRSNSALKPYNGEDGKYVTSIVIKKANRTRTITIDRVTGRISLD